MSDFDIEAVHARWEGLHVADRRHELMRDRDREERLRTAQADLQSLFAPAGDAYATSNSPSNGARSVAERVRPRRRSWEQLGVLTVPFVPAVKLANPV